MIGILVRDGPILDEDSAGVAARIRRQPWANIFKPSGCPHVELLPDLFCNELSIFIQVFLWHVVLGYLMRVNFPLFIILDMLDTRYNASLECIPFLKQFADTFRISAFRVAQSLHVS